MSRFKKNGFYRMADMRSAHQIIPRLWLGDRNAAHDPSFLRTNKITVVFNCTKDIPFSKLVPRAYRIPVDDNLREEEINNMTRWSPEIVAKIIHEYNTGANILVHCFAGMQRSACAVAMTLIALYQQNTDSVIRYIRNKRPVAFFPVANFEKSIRTFDADIHRAMAAKNQGR